MAVSGVSSLLKSSTGTATTGPKLQETDLGVFERLLHQVQKTVGLEKTQSSTAPSANAEQRADVTHFKTDFQRKLVQALLEHGVDLSQPFTLKSDGFGGVEVVGSHPDSEAIEQIFEENSELRQEFGQLADQAERLYSADQTAFQVGNSPNVGSNDVNFGNDRPVFNLIVRDGATEMAFLK